MVSYRDKIAFVFPGQASQHVGMAVELLELEPVARDLFQRAGEILGLDLAAVCTNGDNELLTRTDITQPALLTTSIGWYLVLRARGLRPSILAGHSLGEFAAWVASGAIEFEDALRLVRRRGEFMEEAARRNPGGMLAVIGLEDEVVAGLCQKAGAAGVVLPANFNCPGQVVVSGEEAGLARVAELIGEVKGKCIPLKVSGAFHSPLMEDAAHQFRQLVKSIEISEPLTPVVANVSAELVTDAEGVREVMSEQMTSPVLWSASVRCIQSEGVNFFVEAGPGNVLTKLIERTVAEVRALPTGKMSALNTVVQELHS